MKDIMTPRIVVVASDESMTVEEFHDEHEKLPFLESLYIRMIVTQ